MDHWEFFWMEELPLLSHLLFRQLFISVWTHTCKKLFLLFLFFIGQYCCYLFCPNGIRSSFSLWSSFSWLPCPVHMPPSFLYVVLPFVCFLSSFFHFGIILHFPCSSLEISRFSKELGFLLLENGI